jgi:hypothetical protein
VSHDLREDPRWNLPDLPVLSHDLLEVTVSLSLVRSRDTGEVHLPAVQEARWTRRGTLTERHAPAAADQAPLLGGSGPTVGLVRCARRRSHACDGAAERACHYNGHQQRPEPASYRAIAPSP